MARNNYDDWNFMGELQREERRVRPVKPAKIQQINSQRNSFIFLCIVCLLTFTGLVCVYSASFETAVNSGLAHYYYLAKQAIFIAVGLALAIAVNFIPEKVLKIVSPISFFACIGLLTVDTIFGKSVLMNSDTISFLFLSGVMYMSLYFSGRGNRIEKFSQLIIPVIGCVLVLVLILLQRNFSYALMYLGLSIAMFATGGVGFIGILLLLLYAGVPVACVILSKSERILSVAQFFVPGLGTNPRADQVSMVKSAIASGSWFGKGLGGGVFKNGAIEDLAGKNIIACICEELGFWGLVMIVLFIAFYGFVGYRTAKVIRRQNGFYSNLALGITTMVLWQFFINVAWVLGYIPTDGLPMPFFSYGLSVIPVLIESGILFRISRVKIETEENERVVETISDELMFPERYEFENN